MGTLPDTRFYLDDGTGTFPFDITSKVLLANGMTIKRGREDWQGGVTAGELSITLNNADGRFTPGSTFYGTPSPIKVDQRIRVKETINGVTYTRFTGYVKQWPVAWPATVSTWSTVSITATDAQARAQRWPLRRMLIEELTRDSAVKYLYQLAEAEGSTAAGDTSGNNGPSLVAAGSGAAVQFGQATSTYGLPCAVFSGGAYLSQPATGAAAPLGVGVVFNRSGTPAATEALVLSDSTIQLVMTTAGNISCPATGQVSTNSYADGADHLVEFMYSGGLWVMLVDGAGAAADTAGSAALDSATYTVGGGTGYSTFSGSLAVVTFYSAAFSPARSAAHWSAVNGFPGESGTARITRLAGYANLPIGTLDTSLTNVAATDTTGAYAWDEIEKVAEAEGGLTFFDGSGNLTSHNRNRVASKTTPDLTLDRQYLTGDPQPATDDQQMVNYLEGTTKGTGATQVVRSTTSETSHGRYPASVDYMVQTDAEVLDRGNWIVGNFAEPATRYGTLEFNLFSMPTALAQQVLSAIDLNCWLRVTSMPSQNTGGATADVVVEGFTEEQGGDTWKLSCNVVSRSLFQVWILGDSTFSVLGSTTRLYY